MVFRLDFVENMLDDDCVEVPSEKVCQYKIVGDNDDVFANVRFVQNVDSGRVSSVRVHLTPDYLRDMSTVYVEYNKNGDYPVGYQVSFASAVVSMEDFLNYQTRISRVKDIADTVMNIFYKGTPHYNLYIARGSYHEDECMCPIDSVEE